MTSSSQALKEMSLTELSLSYPNAIINGLQLCIFHVLNYLPSLFEEDGVLPTLSTVSLTGCQITRASHTVPVTGFIINSACRPSAW